MARKNSVKSGIDKKSVEVPKGLMKWRCPHPYKARQRGCLDVNKDNLCIRKEWSGGITYVRGSKLGAAATAEVYCERIRGTLHKE